MLLIKYIKAEKLLSSSAVAETGKVTEKILSHRFILW